MGDTFDPRILYQLPKADTEQTEKVEITENELFRFMFDSFRFSQGSSELQKKFFEWFWHTHSNYNVSDDTIINVEKRIVETTLAMKNSRKHEPVTRTDIENTANSEMSNFVGIGNSTRKYIPDMTVFISDIIRLMQERDKKFQKKRNGKSFVDGIIDGSMKSTSIYFQELLDTIRQHISENAQLE